MSSQPYQKPNFLKPLNFPYPAPGGASSNIRGQPLLDVPSITCLGYVNALQSLKLNIRVRDLLIKMNLFCHSTILNLRRVYGKQVLQLPFVIKDNVPNGHLSIMNVDTKDMIAQRTYPKPRGVP